MSTPYHAAFWAHSLLLEHPRDKVAALARSLGNARVDLNPHQVDAALFALRSPYSRGVLLADEVGLGKTIEALLVLAQKWAERRRRLLLIVPATLRKQWQQELESKFFLPSIILEGKTFNDLARRGMINPFDHGAEELPRVVICSYQFAYAKRDSISAVAWDLVVVDEAHRLRSIYKGTKTAQGIVDSIAPAHKLLLTATPLQNSLNELYGLVGILDPEIFGTLEEFQDQFVSDDGFPTVEDRDTALRDRIRAVCKRTLRQDVRPYVKFTERFALTADFTNSEAEQQLYDEVSTFLQRDRLMALPNTRRKLITLILRKLLASSTRAIAATLQKFVVRMTTEAPPAPDAGVDEPAGGAMVDDYEILDDPGSDDPDHEEPDAVSAGSGPASPSQAIADARATVAEVSDLRRFIELASQVARDSKADRLLSVLPDAFDLAATRGAARKAVIFTESRKTQAYLAQLLSENGYQGQIVLMNGTNTDELSRSIYDAWKLRHKARWADVSSGSKSADMKAAIVEEFRDRATLLIATESAAEGVNLQFCSIVMNYDLPWNPQRIEQRIGRCHRYGQKNDVLVVNFLNRSNEADQRVFDLLNQKLRLFEGVFGSSDAVLGVIASGVDLEHEIAQIYQQCRTSAEINAAFDTLQQQLDCEIQTGRAGARRALLDHFDADIHERLAVHREEAKATLDTQQQTLLDLVRVGLGDRATFVADQPRFSLSSPDGTARAFNLDWHDAEVRDEEFFRLGHELATTLLSDAMAQRLPCHEVTFAYAPHASALAGHQGQRGWLRVSRLATTTLGRTEEFLLVAACDSASAPLAPSVAPKLFALAGVVGEPISEPPPAVLDAITARLQQQHLDEVSRRGATYFDEEADKLQRRSDDLKIGLERDLKLLDRDITAHQKAGRSARTLQEKVDAQAALKALKAQRVAKRREQYAEEDRIAAQHEELIEKMQAELRVPLVTLTPILTVRWRLS